LTLADQLETEQRLNQQHTGKEEFTGRQRALAACVRRGNRWRTPSNSVPSGPDPTTEKPPQQ